ncbi:uncharacterized protein LOC130902344 [Diorhabda carinulata]|uniref:uncharacterized protein LOC130902344 n=1 Tax=Diorhabda carinulata TaxID=1163345 RepID=UPI0025A26591|nr:uncharacterized protein LOC130902344 [Diorhabda carinulata]
MSDTDSDISVPSTPPELKSVVNSELSVLIPENGSTKNVFKDWCDKQNVKTMSENILLAYLMHVSNVSSQNGVLTLIPLNLNGKGLREKSDPEVNLPGIKDSQLALVENVFPNISENYQNYAWLSQRAILAAKNNDVHALNYTIQSKIAGDLVTYKSVDSITIPNDVVNYPTEFLNSLELPGFPPHNLQLKVGTVITILRNLNPPRLCNGT